MLRHLLILLVLALSSSTPSSAAEYEFKIQVRQHDANSEGQHPPLQKAELYFVNNTHQDTVVFLDPKTANDEKYVVTDENGFAKVKVNTSNPIVIVIKGNVFTPTKVPILSQSDQNFIWPISLESKSTVEARRKRNPEGPGHKEIISQILSEVSRSDGKKMPVSERLKELLDDN